MQTPGIGRIVHYCLTDDDVAKAAGFATGDHGPASKQYHEGHPAHAGAYAPAIVVAYFPNQHGAGEHVVNLQVFLDGNDSLWVQSVAAGTTNGTWKWPTMEPLEPLATSADPNSRPSRRT